MNFGRKKAQKAQKNSNPLIYRISNLLLLRLLRLFAANPQNPSKIL